MGIRRKVHHFYNDTYRENFYFMPAFNPREFNSVIRQFDAEAPWFELNSIGMATTSAVDKAGGVYIWLKSSKICPDNLSFLAHECVHAANFVFRAKGMIPDFNNDEAHAYLVQYIFLNCVKVMK